MAEGITTSNTVPAGKEIKEPVLTPEQKKQQKIQDMKALKSYEFQVDNIKLEIDRVERILKLDLANRELRENLRVHYDNLKRFENLISIIKKRQKIK